MGKRSNPPPGLAFGENGQLVGFEEFNYHAIERTGSAMDAIINEEDIARKASSVFIAAIRWVFQSGKNNPDGLKIRTKLLCWHLLPEVEDSYTLTSLAGEEGKAKQSFGRWNDDFRKRFPQLCNRHRQR